jgi:hypothetical protein
MRGERNKQAVAGDLRRERRFPLPVLEFAIGEERFHSVNWSMGGALLNGVCELVGTRVRGRMALSGSRDALPFAGTVIRTDLDTGNCAICFEGMRTESLDFGEQPLAEALH